MHNYRTKRNIKKKRFVYSEIRCFYLRDKIPLYPRICVCINGNIRKNDFKNFQKNVLNIIDKENIESLGFSYIDPYKLSLYVLDNSEYDDKKKIAQEITLQATDIKSNYEKSLKMLDDLKVRIKDKKKLKEINFLYDQHKNALKDNYPEENIGKFYIKIKLFIHKKLSTTLIENGRFIDEFKDVKEMLSIIKGFNIKVNGHTCNVLAYNSKNYGLMGGIRFPYDFTKVPAIKMLPYAKDLIDTMGKPKLVNIGFEFEESPIGLEEITLSFDENNYIVPLSYKYNTDDLDDLVKKNYLQSLKIPKIFLRKIK